MTSAEIKKLDGEKVMRTYGRFDVAIERGEGASLYTPEGEKYIDFAVGIGVNCLGYGNEKWVKAVSEQAGKLQHISNLFYSEPCVRLADKLTGRTGLKNVFFANGGGEANEGMIKCARKYSYDKYGKGRSTVITLYQSFHGRTITTLAATGQDVFHNYFFPFTEGFKYAKANDIDDLRANLTPDVCAVMMELVQGEGGVLPLDEEYVKSVEKLCREKDVLLLIDEVQTGVGRTGSLFCFQQYGIEPDIVSFAKGIAGGLPMAGIMAGEKTCKVLTPGTHATTFGGNPVAAAGGCVVLDTLTEEFLAEVVKKGEYIKDTILSWKNPRVKTVRGRGLMLGVVLEGCAPGDVLKKCVSMGLLALTAGEDALRLLPPLVISYDEMAEGLNILKAVLEDS